MADDAGDKARQDLIRQRKALRSRVTRLFSEAKSHIEEEAHGRTCNRDDFKDPMDRLRRLEQDLRKVDRGLLLLFDGERAYSEYE